ncbi:MAG TPA: cobyrinic acid a,c-diamide synthase, partial [Desulfovibrio sp.]|nr:cobyrinic acid a,c-diamide synthase [Desulfovibrio sp.]
MNALPRLILAGLSGGSGKTIVSLGLCRALVQKGLAVRPFKKGPDYIDAAWLGLAARTDCSNLDPFLLSREVLTALFADKAAGSDLSIIEGNRGLFDGKDVGGSCSTAELARWLDCPVVLVLDCTKMT